MMDMYGLNHNLDSLFPENPDFLNDEEICLRDYEYLRRLYPKEVRLISSILEEYLDRYEFEGSPMYAQYPDAVTIDRMVKEICDRLPKKGNKEEQKQLRNLVHTMLCQEMYVRRRRHDHFCRKFHSMGNNPPRPPKQKPPMK